VTTLRLAPAIIFAAFCFPVVAAEKIEIPCEEYSRLVGSDYCKSAKTINMTPAAYESVKRQAEKSAQKNKCKETPGADGCKQKTVRLWGSN